MLIFRGSGKRKRNEEDFWDLRGYCGEFGTCFFFFCNFRFHIYMYIHTHNYVIMCEYAHGVSLREMMAVGLEFGGCDFFGLRQCVTGLITRLES